MNIFGVFNGSKTISEQFHGRQRLNSLVTLFIQYKLTKTLNLVD